ncbi:hypothetical protein HKX48_006510 [Thoreauomyces humboldtii]|nr:hypothetical protein HKX48_006510 [Thoreauomyces humboldtii]
MGVRAVTYPVSLVKTRLQVAGERKSFQTMKTLSDIFRKEGPRALYQGFTVTALGALPGQILYLSSMEFTKERVGRILRNLHFDENQTALVSGLMGGAVASTSTQLVVVPVDIVAQRLMIQQRQAPKLLSAAPTIPLEVPAPPPPEPQFTTARTLIPHIFQTEGVRGFYRGFFLSLATYAPSSAVWWGTQSLVKRMLENAFYPQEHVLPGDLDTEPNSHLGLAAVSGGAAGLVAACITNPMDVIKTRIQTREVVGRISEFRLFTNTFATLLREEGYRGLTRGGGARMASMALTSVLMITTYETVKKLSYRPLEDLQTFNL